MAQRAGDARRCHGLLVSLAALLPGLLGAEETYRAAADRPVDIEHIRLDVSVDLERQVLEGTATIDFTPLRTVSRLRLDAVGHEVQEVWLLNSEGADPQELEFDNTGTELVIELARNFSPEHRLRVRIAYSVTQPRSGLHFFRPSEAEPDVPWMAWTQGEPRHNRYWFPCSDHPNERQTTEIVATVAARFRVLSNGSLVGQRPAEEDRVTYHWRQEKPHVAYLVTLVVGEFAVVEESWRGRPVLYYAPPGRAADIRDTFGRTTAMLDFFSERFGIEYPWEKYAQVVVEQFTSGGMENTSATTLYEGVMHDERALLDGTPDWLIAHELGHQWWGDLVTCREWAHLWLNEGFASYCEVLWCEHALGRDEADYYLWKDAQDARSGSALDRPIVDRHYSAERTMFDNRAYPKGSWVLHMLRRRVGDAEFFRALQRYGTVYAYQTAETSDLRQIFTQLTGYSLDRFFYDWTERPGHPELSVATEWDADDRMVKVEIRQTQKAEAFHFPLVLEFVTPDSANTVRIERDVTEKEMTVYVPIQERPSLVRVDPDFSLLAEVEESKSQDWWREQLRSAPSVVERMRAVEHFADRKTEADRKLLVTALEQDPFYGVRIEAAKALGKSGGETSQQALLTGLRAEHPKVRRACAAALGEFGPSEEIATALAQFAREDEPSDLVRASTLESLARANPQAELELFRDAFSRTSHRQVVQQSALRGLARLQHTGVLDLLLDWTRPGHYRECRMAAIEALAAYAARTELTPKQQTAVVERLENCLTGEGPYIRRAAATALGRLGDLAQPALTRLEALAQQDAEQRVRAAAETAVTAIRERRPPQADLKATRDELDQLRRRNEELEERLLRLEAR
jgi:aminopeptidase N